MKEPTRISPNYNVEHWNVLTFTTEDDWQTGIAIFEDRIRGRFMNIIDIIEPITFAGFAVMALDCLLIETLQQFREGKKQTPDREAKTYFVRFLTETSFSAFFTSSPMAKMFYKHIRCGILHQAEAKESSLIRIRPGDPLVKCTEDSNGLIINRKLFHQHLVKVFEEYVSSLRDASNEELRSNFKKKMDYICQSIESTNLSMAI